MKRSQGLVVKILFVLQQLKINLFHNHAYNKYMVLQCENVGLCYDSVIIEICYNLYQIYTYTVLLTMLIE